MEIDHGRLEKGVLNGPSQHGENREETNSLETGSLAKHHPKYLHQKQEWGSENHRGTSSHQPQDAGWSDQTTSSLANNVDMEDARNLMDFSVSASSLPPCNVSQPHHIRTAQLYEKFNQEMSSREDGTKQKGWSGDVQHCSPEDLNTLQMALSQARHGNKPPNCDCEGPDCPDYLEWLQKKIKNATNSHDKGSCKMSGASPTEQQHYKNQMQPPTSGTNNISGSEPQNHIKQHPIPRPYGPLPPIPCSPSVLSIAKERNVSLNTAIAIEALTQLSGTGGAVIHHASSHSQHQESSSGPQSSSASSIHQNIPPEHFSGSWEQQRPRSQDPTPHSSQYRSHPSTPNAVPHQWQQNTGAVGASASFLPPSNGSNDPMSGLKQLLEDSHGNFPGAGFKLPVQGQKLNDGQPVMPRVKQEVDNGDYPSEFGSAMSQCAMVNGQQQFQCQQLSQSIRHSTQAALQQHLHYKRNLFSSPQIFSPRTPTACQTLRKWWPQTTENTLGIKQEPKEPKKKKTPQSSPLLKQQIGGLFGSLHPPIPKPKPIVIKKVKQKASQPLFLPQIQITVQKQSMTANVPSPAHQTPSLPGMGAGISSCLPPYNLSQVAASQAAPATTQESILDSISTANAESTPQASTSVTTPVSSGPIEKPSSGLSTVAEGTPATTSTTQTSESQPTPPVCGLGSLDPKFEELIRQFEEEFGDTLPSDTVADGPKQGPIPPGITNSDLNLNSGQSQTQSSSEEELNNTIEPASQPEPSLQQIKGKAEDKGMSSSQVSATKQEPEECPVQVEPSEQHLFQTQHRLGDPLSLISTPPNKRMKIESSGGVTVLSTTGCFSTTGQDLDTPTKDGFPSTPSLKGFLESPLQYLDTPTKSVLDTPVKDSQAEFPVCDCVEQIIEKDEGPYYNHLGSGPTVASIRELMENRFREKGDAIRIEKVVYTGREGKSSQGCPIAKWVIRRSSEKEKLLCLVRHRAGHRCDNAVIIVVILAWEGIPKALGDKLYRELSDTLTLYGNPTSRRCGLNDDRTCACQGKNPERSGASFSFGCSWSMYFNGCKYARSKVPRKFRLQGEHPKEEELVKDNFQNLATQVAPLYKRLAPQAYQNQCTNENVASDCRLGLQEGRPFSGITACMDFCAHAHKDQHNLHNGCTVVCTLTKEDNRRVGMIPEDEQLHVLPLYKVSPTDEFGSEENQRLKMKTGAIQVLSKFPREVRKLPEPAKSCRQRRLEAKKAASEKKNKKQQVSETPEKTIKKEVSLQPQQGNKAIPKQEVKPTIKKEVLDRYHSSNGAVDGYPVHGNGKMCPSPYNMNGAYPSYPSPYGKGGMPSNSQPLAQSPINGFHPNLQGMAYNYNYYPPNALLPPEVLGYEGRNGTWPRAAGAEQKPDVQSIQARIARAYPNHSEQHHQQGPNSVNAGYPSSQSSNTCNRAASAPPDQMHRGTPVIKQEPLDVPLHNMRTDGQIRNCPVTPSTTPQPDAWPGCKPNGVLASKGWDGNVQQSQAHSIFTPENQLSHQQHQNQVQQSQFAQQQQQQWRSYPGTPVASPALKTGPPPSPHPATPQHWSSPAPSPQPKAWGHHGTPVGAFPDKMMSESIENRGSTPQGLQEKAWRSGGACAAGSNPSPAPEGRLFPDMLQKVNGQACWDSEAESERELEEDEVWSDSEHNFLDPNIGGVAVAPGHCSVLIECARRELHATTPLKKPDRSHPSRISLVFYQHKNLNQPCHGLALWEAKMKLLAERARQRQQEAALLGLSQEDMKAYAKKRKWADGAASPFSTPTKDRREGVATRMTMTQHTTTMVTAAPYAFTQLTGPYSRFM